MEKTFKDVHVLRGVDLEVARQRVRPTLVRILATLLSPDAAAVRRSLSLTGQFAAVDEILTGRENLVLVARLRHLPDPGAVADDLLDEPTTGLDPPVRLEAWSTIEELAAGGTTVLLTTQHLEEAERLASRSCTAAASSPTARSPS